MNRGREHPLCTCLRIPSVVATSTSLYAFAECREWRGDGCDPMGSSSSSSMVSVGGESPLGARTHIAMKSSSDGGEHWSDINILTEGCQPTAVYDGVRDTLLFMFKNNTRQDARLMILHADGNWSTPRLVIDPAKQEKHHRPLFPGPGTPAHPRDPECQRQLVQFQCIRSQKHQINSYEISKVGHCAGGEYCRSSRELVAGHYWC
eukprot:SAG31_NODE_12923_length_906_cov_1.197026_1_plen_204_part_10